METRNRRRAEPAAVGWRAQENYWAGRPCSDRNLGVVALVALAGGVDAQSGRDAALEPLLAASAVPFGPGKRRSTNKLGCSATGEGRLVGKLTPCAVRRRTTQMHLKGGVLFAKVDTKYESWFDTDELDLTALPSGPARGQPAQAHVRVLPEEMRWEMSNGESGELPTDMPLDDLSFLYFVRTLPSTGMNTDSTGTSRMTAPGPVEGAMNRDREGPGRHVRDDRRAADHPLKGLFRRAVRRRSTSPMTAAAFSSCSSEGEDLKSLDLLLEETRRVRRLRRRDPPHLLHSPTIDGKRSGRRCAGPGCRHIERAAAHPALMQ